MFPIDSKLVNRTHFDTRPISGFIRVILGSGSDFGFLANCSQVVDLKILLETFCGFSWLHLWGGGEIFVLLQTTTEIITPGDNWNINKTHWEVTSHTSRANLLDVVIIQYISKTNQEILCHWRRKDRGRRWLGLKSSFLPHETSFGAWSQGFQYIILILSCNC